MLARTLEPEAMDSADEADEADRMDHSAVNERFAADFLDVWDCRHPVLDAGTGTALIPLVCCRRSPVFTCIAVDLAGAMLDRARHNVEAAGLASRVVLRPADVKGLPFADGTFAAVMSNSLIHHIPEPARAFAELIRVLKPGGVLFIRDLCRPESAERVTELVMKHAADSDDEQKKLFAESLHAALTLADVHKILNDHGLPAESARMTSDRHWTIAALKPGAK